MLEIRLPDQVELIALHLDSQPSAVVAAEAAATETEQMAETEGQAEALAATAVQELLALAQQDRDLMEVKEAITHLTIKAQAAVELLKKALTALILL